MAGKTQDEKNRVEGSSLLEVQGISSVYLPGRPVFQGLSLSLCSGEVGAIVGASGCGKTTLLRCLAGLQPLAAGAIIFDQKPIAGPIAGLAYMPQHHGLLPWCTVLDNVALPLIIQGVSRQEAWRRAFEGLSRVGLEGLSGRYPQALSGGQQQRTAVARTLVAPPRLLLLDEPLSSLDELTREHLQDAFLALLKELRPVALLVTHSIEEALYLGTKIFVMVPGAPGTEDGARLHYILEKPTSDGPAFRLSGEFGSLCSRLRTYLRNTAVQGEGLHVPP